MRRSCFESGLRMTAHGQALLLAIDSMGFSERLPRQRLMLEGLRNQCTASSESSWADAHGTELIRALVRGLSHVAIRPWANELMVNQPLEVVRTEVCNACATLSPNGSVIFLFRGLIKAILFVLEFGEVVTGLDAQLNTTQDSSYTNDQLQVWAYSAYSMLYHYQAVGERLPRAGGALVPATKRLLLMQFSCVIWFILMHEIGHVQLGHLGQDAATSRLTSPKLAWPESLNTEKLQEFEADLFLCDTLADGEQRALLMYVLAPLDLLASLERHLGGNESTHPSAVNRLQYILDMRSAVLDDRSRAMAADVVSRDLTALQLMRDPASAPRFRVPVEESREALVKLEEFYMLTSAQAAAPSKADVADAKLWDFLVSYFWHDGPLDPSGRVPLAQ